MLQGGMDGFRLSDSSTMNDKEEGRATSDGYFVWRYLKDEVGDESWLSRRYRSAHICCFMGTGRKGGKDFDVGDNLLFWRLYGDDCCGVSITIAEHRSVELVQNVAVQEVTYVDAPPARLIFLPFQSS